MAPTKITARIRYWESKGLSKMVSKKTKVYKETVQKLNWLVEGENMFANTPHTMPDFKLSVDRFALQALDPRFLPINKSKKSSLKRTSLSHFLHNPFAAPGFHSRYKHCLEHKPVPFSPQPKVFNSLVARYIGALDNGIKTFDDLSTTDHLNLSYATNKLTAFQKKTNGKLDPVMSDSHGKLVGALIKATMHFIRHDLTRFDTTLLTRNWVWDKFPNYLNQNGYLVSEKPFSIYNS